MSRYEPRAYKRLTDNERAEAVALWEAGSSTIEDLAGRFDCSPRALLYLFKREGVTKGSKAATFAAEIRAETFADAGKIQHLIMSQNLFGKSWVSVPADKETDHRDMDQGDRDIDTALVITEACVIGSSSRNFVRRPSGAAGGRSLEVQVDPTMYRGAHRHCAGGGCRSHAKRHVRRMRELLRHIRL